jgi:hypothetical protein
MKPGEITNLVLDSANDANLYDLLLPHKAEWNKTPELMQALIDGQVSATCLRKLIANGLDIHKLIGNDAYKYTAVEYSALNYPTHFYVLSIELCYSHRSTRTIEYYFERYIALVLCASLDDEVESEPYVEAWYRMYEYYKDYKFHLHLFHPVLVEIENNGKPQEV